MLPGNHYFMINCFPAQIAVEEFGGGLGAGGKVRHLMVEGKIRGAEPRARGVSGTDSRERAGAPAAGPGQVAAQRNGPVRGLRRKRGAGASRQAARGEFSPPQSLPSRLPPVPPHHPPAPGRRTAQLGPRPEPCAAAGRCPAPAAGRGRPGVGGSPCRAARAARGGGGGAARNPPESGAAPVYLAAEAPREGNGGSAAQGAGGAASAIPAGSPAAGVRDLRGTEMGF